VEATTPLAARVALRTGERQPSEVVDEMLPYIDAEIHQTRTRALWTAAEAVRQCPERVVDVADRFVDSLEHGQYISEDQLEALNALAQINARALGPVVEALAPAGAGDWAYEGPRPVVHAVLGEIGVQAPGVAKPAVDPLVAAIDNSFEASTQEAAWALTRIAATEPSTVRPLIAGQLWSLDSANPAVVTEALDTLGIVFALCPDNIVELDEVAACLSHPQPSVREAAVQALKRTAFGVLDDEARLGRGSLTRIEPYLDRVMTLASDEHPDVRGEVVRTLRLVASARPERLGRLTSVVAARCDDSKWLTRTAAIETIESLTEAGQFDLSMLRRVVSPCLEDDDSTVRQAASECLTTALQTRSDDDPDTARLLLDDLLWAACREDIASDLFGDSDKRFRAISDLGRRVWELCSVDRYVNLAEQLTTVESDDARVTAAHLLFAIVTSSERRRWDAIGSLQSLLGDDSRQVREQAVSTCVDLLGIHPELRHTLADPLVTTVTYDGALLQRATDDVERLAAVDQGAAIRLGRQYNAIDTNDIEPLLDDDSGILVSGSYNDSDESPTEILATIASVSPDPLKEAVPVFRKRLAAHEGHDVVGAHGLAQVAADTDSSIDAVQTFLQEGLDRWDPPPVVVGWMATALVLSGTEGTATARDMLHSVAETDDVELWECLQLLLKQDPDTAAALVATVAPDIDLDGLDSGAEQAVVEQLLSRPRFLLTRTSRAQPVGRPPNYTLTRPATIQRNHTSQFHEPYPGHTVLSYGSAPNGAPPEADLLRAGPYLDGVAQQRLAERHPSSAVRAAGKALTSDRDSSIDRPNCFDTQFCDATRDTVAKLVAQLATTDIEHAQAASARLITLADARADLQESIVLHCLVAHTTLAESAPKQPISEVLTALARSAGLRQEASLIDSSATLIAVYSCSDSNAVREVVATLPRFVSPDCQSEMIYQELRHLLDDESHTVRERAARSLHSSVQQHPQLARQAVPALREALDSSRHATSAVVEALGTCLAFKPEVSEAAIRAIEKHLKSRSRGVRRAAGRALATVGMVHPAAISPVTDTLLDRLHKDEAGRGVCTLALATGPYRTLDTPRRIARGTVPVLLNSTEPAAAHAAGTILYSLSETHPDEVSAAIEETLIEFEESVSTGDGPLDSDWYDAIGEATRYWLLRVVTALVDEGQTTGEASQLFDHLLEACQENLLGLKLDDIGSPKRDLVVTYRALISTIIDYAAAAGGINTMERALKACPKHRALPDVTGDQLADFILETDSDEREEMDIRLATLSDSQLRCAALQSLVTQLPDSGSNIPYDALTTLAASVTDHGVHRSVVAVAREALTDTDVETRYAGLQLMAELGKTDVLPADEALFHLFICLSDHQWVQKKLTEEIVELVPHAEIPWESVCQMVVSRLRDSGPSTVAKRGALLIATDIAVRRPELAELCTRSVLACLTESSEQLRALAGECLYRLASDAPSAVRPYENRLREYATSDIETTAYSASRCLSEL